MPKCISFLILISNVRYFECADFKSDIGFQKFEPKSTNASILFSKSINFLNLMKFCLCHISNCWYQIWHLFTKISNANPQIWTFWPKSIINFFISSKFYLNAILKACVFCGPWQHSAQVTRINSMPPFCNLFEKHFFRFFKNVSTNYGLSF